MSKQLKGVFEIDDITAPNITIDPSLDKYSGVILFPEKLAKANEQLKKSGFPNLSTKSKAAK